MVFRSVCLPNNTRQIDEIFQTASYPLVMLGRYPFETWVTYFLLNRPVFETEEGWKYWRATGGRLGKDGYWVYKIYCVSFWTRPSASPIEVLQRHPVVTPMKSRICLKAVLYSMRRELLAFTLPTLPDFGRPLCRAKGRDILKFHSKSKGWIPLRRFIDINHFALPQDLAATKVPLPLLIDLKKFAEYLMRSTT